MNPKARNKWLARSLSQYAAALQAELERTHYEVLPGYLPTRDLCTSKRLADYDRRYSEYAAKTPDADGYIGSTLRPSMSRFQRLVCGVSFINERNTVYFVEMLLVSPVGDAEFGRRPLTLQQWALFLEPYITTRVLWQWLPALALETADPTWRLHTRFGWFEQTGNRRFPNAAAAREEKRRDVDFFDPDYSAELYGWPGELLSQNAPRRLSDLGLEGDQ